MQVMSCVRRTYGNYIYIVVTNSVEVRVIVMNDFSSYPIHNPQIMPDKGEIAPPIGNDNAGVSTSRTTCKI